MKRNFYKEDLQDLLRDEDLSPTGNVDELIDRLVEEAGYNVFRFLDEFDKKDLKEICEDHDLPVSGTKDDLVERILEEVIEISEEELQWMGIEFEEEAEPETEELPDDRRKVEEDHETRPVLGTEVRETSRDKGFEGLVQAIREWTPYRRYTHEDGYATDLRGYLQNAKGFDCRAEAGESNADIEADGRYPIEVKKNPRLSQYDRLIGQLVRHCRSKGCAIAVICDVKRGDLFSDFKHNIRTSLVLSDRIAVIDKPL